MKEIQDKYKERWQNRKKASYNWTKLILMTLALIGIIIVLNQLAKVGSAQTKPAAETTIEQKATVPDSSAKTTTPTEEKVK